MNRGALVRWSPLLVALAAAAGTSWLSLRPGLDRIEALRGAAAALEAEAAEWRWVDDVRLPERAVAGAEVDSPATARGETALSEHVERLATRVRGTGVRLLRIEPSVSRGLFEVEVRGSFPTVLGFLRAFEEAPVEVRGVRKTEDGASIVASLHFRGTAS